jgi:hypothetical protein
MDSTKHRSIRRKSRESNHFQAIYWRTIADTSWPDNFTFPSRHFAIWTIIERGYFAINSMDSWVRLAEVLNCTDGVRMGTGSELDCVKAANASTIKDIVEVNILEFQQVIDNVTVFADPTQRRLTNNIANAPILLGIIGQQGRIIRSGRVMRVNTSTGLFRSFLRYRNSSRKHTQLGKKGWGMTMKSFRRLLRIYLYLPESSHPIFFCHTFQRRSLDSWLPTWLTALYNRPQY